MNSSVKVVHPSGVLNGAQGSAIRQEVNSFLQSGTELILIDLENITFIDSSGLGALVIAFKSVRAAGSKLFLCSVGEQPRMLFELTGMERIFEVFPNREAFNQSIELSSESNRTEQF